MLDAGTIEANPITNPLENLSALRLTADRRIGSASKVLLQINLRKPSAHEFVRTHPDDGYGAVFPIFEHRPDGNSKDLYLVMPDVEGYILSGVHPYRLQTAITRKGDLILWPLRLPEEDGRKPCVWHITALEIADRARDHWMRMSSNMGTGSYEAWQADGEIPDPDWPNLTYDQILKLAFKDGGLIDTPDHPIIAQVLGR
jgi:hypothetical protein